MCEASIVLAVSTTNITILICTCLAHFTQSGETQLTIVGPGRIEVEGFLESPEAEGWTPRTPKSWHWKGFRQLFQARLIRMKTIRVMLAHCRKLEKRGSKAICGGFHFCLHPNTFHVPFTTALNSHTVAVPHFCRPNHANLPSLPFAKETNLLPLFLLSTFLLFPRRFQVQRLCSSLPWQIH